MVELYPAQLEAVNKLKVGSVLCGGVGSGKSITSVSYYYLTQGGDPAFLNGGKYKRLDNPKRLYIITTAQKRDKLEWEKELQMFYMSTFKECTIYDFTVVVDSWNNISKYNDIEDSFFIFDEQRVVGYGVWAKSFINIAKNNMWILLSATPGDKWEDYIALFIANGFYKNKTEFEREHIVYDPWSKYRKVSRYLSVRRLERLRNNILITMDVERTTIQHHEYIKCDWDRKKYQYVQSNRWNVFKNKPCETAGELCQTLRHVVNMDDTRIETVKHIFKMSTRKRVIIFYNYDYELDILRNIDYGEDVVVAEWNGHYHESIPETDHWVYLVQYTAGAEGWNCVKTDTIIFYSQNYSYKIMIQAAGRIDRLNTLFVDLHYYHLTSTAPIDRAIKRAVDNKKKFQEGAFIKW